MEGAIELQDQAWTAANSIHVICSVIDVQVQLVDQDNPTGLIKGRFVKIRGCPIRMEPQGNSVALDDGTGQYDFIAGSIEYQRRLGHGVLNPQNRTRTYFDQPTRYGKAYENYFSEPLVSGVEGAVSETL